MIKKKSCLIFSLFILSALTNPDKELSGEYSTGGSRKKNSRPPHYFVKLKADHTFIKELYCCLAYYRAKGTWSRSNDTLFLNVRSQKDLRYLRIATDFERIEKYLITPEGLQVVYQISHSDSLTMGSLIKRMN